MRKIILLLAVVPVLAFANVELEMQKTLDARSELITALRQANELRKVKKRCNTLIDVISQRLQQEDRKTEAFLKDPRNDQFFWQRQRYTFESAKKALVQERCAIK